MTVQTFSEFGVALGAFFVVAICATVAAEAKSDIGLAARAPGDRRAAGWLGAACSLVGAIAAAQTAVILARACVVAGSTSDGELLLRISASRLAAATIMAALAAYMIVEVKTFATVIKQNGADD